MADKRKPSLFLRSFDDDARQKHSFHQEVDLVDFSLQTRLSKHFMYFGPFIAIGKPTDTVPIPGAARVKLSDDEWQARVTSWIFEAALILMFCAKSDWVNWELATIIERGRMQNLILMMPEPDMKKSRRLQSEDVTIRINRIRQVLKSTVWSNTFEEIQDWRHVRAMVFGSGGSMIVVRSQDRGNREAGHLAALIADYIVLNESYKATGKRAVSYDYTPSS